MHGQQYYITEAGEFALVFSSLKPQTKKQIPFNDSTPRDFIMFTF